LNWLLLKANIRKNKFLLFSSQDDGDNDITTMIVNDNCGDKDLLST